MTRLTTPISEEDIKNLNPGDIILISGWIFCGRDAVLPKIVKMLENGEEKQLGADLRGQVIFHTAVSPAGVGPTSSNKLEIESSIAPLSKAGVRVHLGKGRLSPETVKALEEKTLERRVAAFPELGMEALHLIRVEDYPAIIGAARGRSIYDREV